MLEHISQNLLESDRVFENIFDRNRLSPDNTIKDLNNEYLKFIDFEHKAKLKKDFIRNISEYNIKKLTNKHTKTILSHGLTYPTLIYITNTFMLKSIEFTSEKLNGIEPQFLEPSESQISFFNDKQYEIFNILIEKYNSKKVNARNARYQYIYQFLKTKQHFSFKNDFENYIQKNHETKFKLLSDRKETTVKNAFNDIEKIIRENKVSY